MSVGQNIKSRRKQLGMNAETLAEKLGVSPSTIYRYESGDIEKVDAAKLIPIAEALQTTPAYLMGWETEEAGKKLKSIGEQLTALTRSPEWRVLSEGLGVLEKKNNVAFHATYNYLTAMYPDIFTERNDDDDPRP